VTKHGTFWAEKSSVLGTPARKWPNTELFGPKKVPY